MSKSAELDAEQDIGFRVKLEQLARSPLGIVALCLVVVVIVLGYSARFKSLQALWSGIALTAFVVGAFFYTLIRHPEILLYSVGASGAHLDFLRMIAAKAATPVPTPPEPWHNPKIFVGEFLPGGEVTTTTLMGLFESLSERHDWIYLLVDIEEGHKWLLSRLFIFSVVLKQVRGIRCIVFVETTPSQNKTFLGLAEPSKVRELLGQKYPWFEDALRESWANVGSPVLPDNMPLDQAKEVMEGFIFCTLMRTQQESLDDPEWSRLKGDQWDHSRWLDSLQLKQDLTAACYAFSDSTVTRARRDSDAA